VVAQDPVLHNYSAASWQALGIKRRCAEAANLNIAHTVFIGDRLVEDKGSVVNHGDVVTRDTLAKLASEEAGMAIDCVAVCRVEDVADDAARNLRREDDRGLLCLHAACAQAAKCATRGLLADLDWVVQQAGRARG